MYFTLIPEDWIENLPGHDLIEANIGSLLPPVSGRLPIAMSLGCSTGGSLVMATKRSFVKNENQGSCQRRALGVYTWDIAYRHARHLGPCRYHIGEIRRSRAQTAELPSSPFQWWMDDTWMMVETKLRVPPWLAIATIVKGHHMSTPCAAWGRPRCPHVMTTTLCVNAQELR